MGRWQDLIETIFHQLTMRMHRSLKSTKLTHLRLMPPFKTSHRLFFKFKMLYKLNLWRHNKIKAIGTIICAIIRIDKTIKIRIEAIIFIKETNSKILNLVLLQTQASEELTADKDK